MSEHETPNLMHGILRGSFANSAARLAYVVTATDLAQGRVWRQTDTLRDYVAIATGAGSGSWRLLGSGDGGGGGGAVVDVVAVPGDLTLVTATHSGKTLLIANSAPRAITFPASPPDNTYFDFKCTGTATVTWTRAGSETVEGASANYNMDQTGVDATAPAKASGRWFAFGGAWYLAPSWNGVVINVP